MAVDIVSGSYFFILVILKNRQTVLIIDVVVKFKN